MVITFPWVLSQLMKTNAQQGTQLDVAPLPQFFAGPRSVVATSHIYCIPKQRKNNEWIQAEAQKFIAWLVREGSVDCADARLGERGGRRGHCQGQRPGGCADASVIDEAKHARFAPYAYRWTQEFEYLDDALATSSARARTWRPSFAGPRPRDREHAGAEMSVLTSRISVARTASGRETAVEVGAEHQAPCGFLFLFLWAVPVVRGFYLA